MFSKQKRVLPVIEKGMKIAFVCYGNICRSPFAELYAEIKYKDYEFYSFGFIEENNRPSPENAIIAAKKWNIDLEKNKSKYLTEEEVNKLDVIFVMDKLNYIMYKTLYKNYLNKVYFLNNAKEIEDPWEKDAAYFEYIYTLISNNIDRVFASPNLT